MLVAFPSHFSSLFSLAVWLLGIGGRSAAAVFLSRSLSAPSACRRGDHQLRFVVGSASPRSVVCLVLLVGVQWPLSPISGRAAADAPATICLTWPYRRHRSVQPVWDGSAHRDGTAVIGPESHLVSRSRRSPGAGPGESLDPVVPGQVRFIRFNSSAE